LIFHIILFIFSNLLSDHVIGEHSLKIYFDRTIAGRIYYLYHRMVTENNEYLLVILLEQAED